MRMRLWTIGTVCVLLFGAQSASAATVTVAPDARFGLFNEVRYVAAPGEKNALVVAYADDALTVTVTDPGATITVAGSCTSLTIHSAICRAPNPPFPVAGQFVTGTRAELGDMDDRVSTTGRGTIDAFAGSGDDVLLGGINFDRLDGGGGHDMLSGGEGSDTLSDGDRDGAAAGLGPDADVLDGGGDDTDEISYAQRTSGVRVDLTDATGPENDTLRGFEWATGGAGDDRLSGDAQDNRLDGRRGLNRLTGRDGDDFLSRASGDVARCGRGDDFVDGPRAATLLPSACERLSLRQPRGELADTAGSLRPTLQRRRSRLRFALSCPDLDGDPVACTARLSIRTRSGRLLASGRLGAPRNESDRERFLRVSLTALGERLRGNGRRDLGRVVLRGKIAPTTRWTVGF